MAANEHSLAAMNANPPGTSGQRSSNGIGAFLAWAEGPEPTVDFALPFVRGGHTTIQRLSVDKIQAGNAAENVRVQAGDTVFVVSRDENSFFVFGEVKRPGAYPLEKETNILEGITIAGGFTDKASPSRTRVIRVGTTGQQVLEIDMNDIIKRGQRDKAVGLQANDVVVVPESFF